MDAGAVLAREFPEVRATYTARDTILYALGTGFATEPLDAAHLRFLYENGLVASPTFANVLGHPGFWASDAAYGIDWAKLLHAEQRLVLHGMLPPAGEVVARSDIMGLRDQGTRGAMLFQRKQVADAASGAPLAAVVTSLMLRGDGGCGDHGPAPDELAKLPETAPTSSLIVPTLPIAALIYRLSGDLNPLHIDPAVAARGGFPQPILHGLATMGFAGYALLRTYCRFDPARLKAIAVRFTRPVLPGDTLRFDFWGTAPGTIRFRAVVGEATVLDRGTAEVA